MVNIMGQGLILISNGDKYVGEWENGQNHGQGTYSYASGNQYCGEWKDNNKHGKEPLLIPMEIKYLGQNQRW